MDKHSIFQWSDNWYFFCAWCSEVVTATSQQQVTVQAETHVHGEHMLDSRMVSGYPTGEPSHETR